MIQIRRRWPALATVVAALAYGANHYQIAGIEQLRLEPRPQTQPNANSYPTGYGQPGWSFDLSQFENQVPPIPAPNNSLLAGSKQSLPVWKDNLSVGEKLAMWESNSEGSTSSLAQTTRPLSTSTGFPVSSPIPPPPGFALSTQLPSTLPPASDGSVTGNLAPALLEPIGPTFPTTAPIQNPPPKIPMGNTASVGLSPQNVAASTVGRAGKTIRVASFNTQSLGPAKMSKSHVVEALVSIVRQYDIIALQEVQSTRDDLLPMIVDKLNQSGRTFDYVIGPRVGRAEPHDQFAILFDTSRVETDRYQLYTVDDPEDLMNYEPLVAWFRCKGVPADEAFTFSLANVRIDSNFADAERAILPSLIEAIQQDGRGEDDWIVAGDFAGGVSQLSALDTGTVRFAVRDIPTNVAGDRMLDTICFSSRATAEFTGRAGAFDFLRKYNLSIERALEISDHLPIWAEFSIVEGAEPGRIAPTDPQTVY